MKPVFLLLLSFFCTACFAQTQWYVAAKSGLSIREKPNAKAAVLVKIPYGTAVSVVNPDSTVSISVEGITASWVKTTYEGKTGYIINAYLLPEAPPKAGVTTMKAYLAQLSAPSGGALLAKKEAPPAEEGGTQIQKQLYKNGAEFHSVTGYEWHHDTYFLPDFTIEQGFVLMRLLPEFKTVFSESDALPLKSKTYKKGASEYAVKIETDVFGGYTWMKRISVEFEDGAIYTFEMFTLGGQLVISFGGGV